MVEAIAVPVRLLPDAGADVLTGGRWIVVQQLGSISLPEIEALVAYLAAGKESSQASIVDTCRGFIAGTAWAQGSTSDVDRRRHIELAGDRTHFFDAAIDTHFGLDRR